MTPRAHLTACLVLVGCTHAPSPAVPRPDEAELSYTIELVRAPSTEVKVTLVTAGSPEGTTTFRIGEGWGGADHPERDLRDFAVADERGRSLAVEARVDGDELTWVVHHAPGERLAASYVLPGTGPVRGDDTSIHRAIVRDHLVQLIGNNTLVYPEALADRHVHRIRLAWRGFTEAGWRVGSSFGGHPSEAVAVSLDDFRDAVFVAADDLRSLTRRVGAGTVELGISGRWSFRDDQLADLVASIIGTERAFFADPGPPYYFLDAIPLDAPREGAATGSGLTHSFHAAMSPAMTLGRQVAYLIAHEHFHTWNGGLLEEAGDDDWDTKWFTEGFTDFYAWRLLYRAGLISLDDVLAELQRTVLSYMSSPARDLPNAKIADAYWTDADVGKLPYLRGSLAALLVDREMRRTSSGRFGLDDQMRQLVAEARRGGKISTDSLLAAFAAHTSAPFAARLRASLVEGQVLPLALDALEPCLSGENEDAARWDLGFDLDGSLKVHRVTGVRADSAAARAGLRDGQVLSGRISVYGGDPTREAVIGIAENGAKREVHYLPRGAEVTIPRFTIHDASACPQVLGGAAR